MSPLWRQSRRRGETYCAIVVAAGEGGPATSSVQSTDGVPNYFQPQERIQDVPGSEGPLPT
eukprot:5378542-Karenia_brevis.AAC.1